MDRTEVTQEQFARLEMPDPSHFRELREPGRADYLASSPPLLQSALASRGAGAVLQRTNRGVRLPSLRVPPSHRGRMGICLSGGKLVHVLVRQRLAKTARVRLVCRKLVETNTSCRPKETQSLGTFRHARERRRVVQRCLRSRVLPQQSVRQSEWTCRGKDVRVARRCVVLQRRTPPLCRADVRHPRLYRRVPGSRRHRLPLRPQTVAPRNASARGSTVRPEAESMIQPCCCAGSAIFWSLPHSDR